MDRSPLVTTGWLADHLSDPSLRVFDTTVHLDPSPSGFETRSGRAGYEAEHIRGAGFLDVLAELSDPGAKIMFTRPSPECVADVLSRSGVSHDHTVVLYSAGDVMWATRAWWLLRWVGLASVFVLDGGFAKWATEGRPVSRESCTYPETPFDARPNERLWAGKEDVLHTIGDGGVCILNALPRQVHSGSASLGYRRPGHIAGSVNLPFSDILDPADGTYRPPSELREHFGATGALEKEHVICYCGGGIAATQNALALVILGHPSVAVYDGGLDEWSRDLKLPMEADASGGPA